MDQPITDLTSGSSFDFDPELTKEMSRSVLVCHALQGLTSCSHCGQKYLKCKNQWTISIWFEIVRQLTVHCIFPDFPRMVMVIGQNILLV